MAPNLPKLLRRKQETPLPDAIEFEGGRLPLTVRHNPRAKRLILRIAPGGTGLVVTAPRGMANRKIREFLDRHRGWVEERVSRGPERVTIVPGATIPIRGEPVLLVHRGGRMTTRLEIANEAGEGPARELLVGGAPEHFSRRVLDFLRREARDDLLMAVKRHSAAVGLEPRGITIKDTTSRWGSCSHDRRLAFSWRIIMAPPHVLDYLAAHEVAHFREMNHGPNFWALCRDLCAETEAGKAWLKRHGSGLHAIGVG
ncbi:M48 family metallopeptidase [Jiella marina]|uniref:M48 family metallopeptidase n=1 Tax=Jiella sp. LLJ827 TaxID=2917712 RepID=UPI00210070E2|nr:M48 family metallopeptidase [Jiella sp. LLJ827]